MKATPDDLLNAIRELGQGELAEHHILRHMGISHGQFCQLRKILVEACRLIVTHPNRRAHYLIAAETAQDTKSNESNMHSMNSMNSMNNIGNISNMDITNNTRG